MDSRRYISLRNLILPGFKYNVGVVLITLFSISVDCLALEDKIIFIPDCAVKESRGLVDIHVMIRPPGQTQTRILNLLCQKNLTNCSAVLVNPDFVHGRTLRDSSFKHLENVKISSFSNGGALLTWRGNVLKIDKDNNQLFWQNETGESVATCTDPLKISF